MADHRDGDASSHVSGMSDVEVQEAVELSPTYLKSMEQNRSAEPEFLQPDSFGYDPPEPSHGFLSSILAAVHLKKAPAPSSTPQEQEPKQEPPYAAVDPAVDRGKEPATSTAAGTPEGAEEASKHGIVHGSLSPYLPREDYLDWTGAEPELSILVPAFPRKEGNATLKSKRKKVTPASPRSPRQLLAEKKHLEKMRVNSPRLEVKPSKKDWIGSGGISGEDYRAKGPSRRSKSPNKSKDVPCMSIRLDMDRMEFEAKDLPSSIVKKPRAVSVRIDESSAWRSSPTGSPPRPGTPKRRSPTHGYIDDFRLEDQSAAAGAPLYTSVVFPMPWSSSKPNFCRSALDLFPVCNLPPEPKGIAPVACPPMEFDLGINKSAKESPTVTKSTVTRHPHFYPTHPRKIDSRKLYPALRKNVPKPDQSPENSWNAGICDCWDDPETCCVTGFAPCITFGRVAETMDDDLRSCFINGLLYCLPGLSCYYASRYRTRLREKYSLPGCPRSDFVVHCLCGCCALAQEFQELKAHRPSEGAELQSMVNPGWTRESKPEIGMMLRSPPITREREVGESSEMASQRPTTIAPSLSFMERAPFF